MAAGVGSTVGSDVTAGVASGVGSGVAVGSGTGVGVGSAVGSTVASGVGSGRSAAVTVAAPVVPAGGAASSANAVNGNVVKISITDSAHARGFRILLIFAISFPTEFIYVKRPHYTVARPRLHEKRGSTKINPLFVRYSVF